ncbi:MAG: hypothetical protein JNL11_01285 [Bdellovibrionaceae bacterium]|nr:hypothetical protein [Pseudobdellovibrionaceae bacterium]
MKYVFLKLSLSALIILQCACASVTTVETTDKDALISREGKNDEAKGSLGFRDGRPFYAKTNLIVEKDGCQTQRYTVYKTDEFHPEAFFITLFTTPYVGLLGVLPLLWITTYEKKYVLNYTCLKRGEK